MSMYELPKIKLEKGIWISVLFGFLGGLVAGALVFSGDPDLNVLKSEERVVLSQEENITKVVKETLPAVVSIVISKNVPVYEQGWEVDPFGIRTPVYRQKGTEKQEVGGGTGFIVSEDGLILTNKHVVLDNEADYTVFLNDGRKFSAEVLDKDPVQDLAIIKIRQDKETNEEGDVIIEKFPVLRLGDSDSIEIGQTVIAVGNALAEFNNTVSSGIISGLGRSIVASGESFSETLSDTIQTDAAINKGNSGGPLLNLKGEVVGVNTAIANDAQSIGFSIPINYAKRGISQIKEGEKIVYPFIGIKYLMINQKIKEQEELSVDYGVLIVNDEGIYPDSPAQEAGLKEGDVVLELDGKKITQDYNLTKILIDYSPGDKVILKILRDDQEQEVELTLSERPEI